MLKTIVILLFFSFALTGCSAQDKAIVKELQAADPYLWDFGRRQEGEILKHTFVLRNDSDRTLNIKDINTSCGCTVSEVKSKVIAPKESTTIDIKFNTKGYSGAIKQYVYVHTDTPDNPVIRFTVSAQIIRSK